jgi:hypothetical protein
MKHHTAVLNFRSHGKYHVPGHRPSGDAWRLRWWYHSAVLKNHKINWRYIECVGQASNYPHGSFPLKPNKRWADA